MSGRATLTMVASSTTISWAVAMTPGEPDDDGWPGRAAADVVNDGRAPWRWPFPAGDVFQTFGMLLQ